jgi:hypothetical protein
LATSSSEASRRPTACTSSLPLGRDPSLSLKLSARQHIDSSGEMGVDGVFWYTKHVHYNLVWI